MTDPVSVDLTNWYIDLPDSDKVTFLACVSHQLTIHGRGFGLDLSGEQQAKALLGLNELQHQISGQVGGIVSKHERYPEDVFVQILIEKAAWYGISAHLIQSFEFARGRTP
jgi:hypothetical protein